MKFDITRKIPPFGEAYYKARKQYVLFSGILLSWKLLGFQIGEYPLPNYQISIKHPNAIQFIFVILVCYLAFRYTIEWHQ
ncbi:MAG: hypothetical protein U9Q89_06135, partial [Thermodesulfobacteriota bacterium]|nr:hypothetical protein [Thermodesulfobacteriota bacterium]